MFLLLCRLSIAGKRTNLQHLVCDASIVCKLHMSLIYLAQQLSAHAHADLGSRFRHGRDRDCSIRGIKIALDFFKEMGHRCTVFIPSTFVNRNRTNENIQVRVILGRARDVLVDVGRGSRSDENKARKDGVSGRFCVKRVQSSDQKLTAGLR